MDTAVALVQAYLNINGYFTVVEYPVLGVARGESPRTVTDLDILAFRFANAGHEVVRAPGHRPMGGHPLEVDPVLGAPLEQPDMIVGEVKEGAARFNTPTLDQAVLEVALRRFGCCSLAQAAQLAQRLLSTGAAENQAGHVMRMVAFGEVRGENPARGWRTVSMSHVVAFVQQYLHEHWDVLRHAQIKDEALGVLALLEKWSDDGAPGR